MRMSRQVVIIILTIAVLVPAWIGCVSRVESESSVEAWTPLFDGRSIDGWKVTLFGGEGSVDVEDGMLVLDIGNPLTGITWPGDFPVGDYEVRIRAARLDGSDFFCGLTFPVGDAHLTLVLGGWGGSVVGLSCLDGQDASENETTRYEAFTDGHDYELLLSVELGGRVTARLDGATIIDVETEGKELTLRPEVFLNRPFGVASFQTRAGIREISWRRLLGKK